MPSDFIPVLRFSFLTPYYDFLIRLLLPENKLRNALIDAAQVTTQTNFIDAGCGTATLSLMLAKKFPHAAITAFDVDEMVLIIADKKIKSKSISNIKLVRINSNNLPFENETFDMAFTCFLFCNLIYDDKIKMIAELHRLLKPDSKLMIAEWSKPESFIAAIGFFIMQCVGGFKNTADIKKGMLPFYLNQNNFKVDELIMFNTLFGTIKIYNALKI